MPSAAAFPAKDGDGLDGTTAMARLPLWQKRPTVHGCFSRDPRGLRKAQRTSHLHPQVESAPGVCSKLRGSISALRHRTRSPTHSLTS